MPTQVMRLDLAERIARYVLERAADAIGDAYDRHQSCDDTSGMADAATSAVCSLDPATLAREAMEAK